jgi:hypothetical protein
LNSGYGQRSGRPQHYPGPPRAAARRRPHG